MLSYKIILHSEIVDTIVIAPIYKNIKVITDYIIRDLIKLITFVHTYTN
jgi:hypothetical protein